MKTYEFNVMLKDTTEVTDDQADALFAAGCEDGTPASSNGTAWVHFDRQASSLEEAAQAFYEACARVIKRCEELRHTKS